ncbi:MAG: DUF3853 family protein [Bacteroidales bacterium]|nr:DUF3853 family protein [Bacteroidales bacterium]
MERTIIRGSKGLADILGVHFNTVLNWRKKGLLDKATVAEYGRVILYDLELVLECLHHTPVKQGRREAV